jgi:hypothetical protein
MSKSRLVKQAILSGIEGSECADASAEKLADLASKKVMHFLANKFGPIFIHHDAKVREAAEDLWRKITGENEQ